MQLTLTHTHTRSHTCHLSVECVILYFRCSKFRTTTPRFFLFFFSYFFLPGSQLTLLLVSQRTSLLHLLRPLSFYFCCFSCKCATRRSRSSRCFFFIWPFSFFFFCFQYNFQLVCPSFILFPFFIENFKFVFLVFSDIKETLGAYMEFEEMLWSEEQGDQHVIVLYKEEKALKKS